MRVAGFIVINLLIFSGWYLWLAGRQAAAVDENGPRDALVYGGLLGAIQIVLGEILLGAAGLLRFPALLAVQLGISGLVTGWALLGRGGPGHWRHWSQRLRAASPAVVREACGVSNVALLVLALFLLTWMTVAAWLLPPRGVDDLVYHLPPLFEAAQSGQLTLLDLQLRHQFAMPMAGDFLALWPLVFFHAVTWIDLVQFVVALFGVAVLFALARALGTGRRDALFIALLFLFVPVVLGQSGSNYTDVTLAVCHLVLLYAAVRFWQDGSLFHIAMAGLAAGFGLGVKYSMLVAIAGVQPLVLLRLWRDRSLGTAWRGYALAIAAALLVPGYWLVRNYLVTGFPLYPYDLALTGLSSVPGTATDADAPGTGPTAGTQALFHLYYEPVRFLTFLLRDPGLGSLNGGLGAVFWGLGVPALVYCGCRALRVAASRDFFPALLWGQVPLLAGVYLFQTDISRLVFNQRLIIALIGFGLLALGVLLSELRARVPGAIAGVRGFGVLACVLATAHLASSALPSFQIRDAVLDRARHRETSPYRYHSQASGDLPTQSVAWDALDFLTLPGPGWDVYLSAPWSVFSAAPAYGTRLQNRVWNFQARPGREPDALVFHFGLSPGWEQWYLGRPITAEQARSDPRYELVRHVPSTQLWVRRQRLAEPATRARLIEFYRRSYGADIETLRVIVPRLPAAGELVTSTPWGHALKYLGMTGALGATVHLVPAGSEGLAARQLGTRAVLTVTAPLPGARGRELARMDTADGEVIFYINELES